MVISKRILKLKALTKSWTKYSPYISVFYFIYLPQDFGYNQLIGVYSLSILALPTIFINFLSICTNSPTHTLPLHFIY